MSFSFPSFAETGQQVFGHNDKDEKGQIHGGDAQDGTFQPMTGRFPGFVIRWQNGPVNREAGQRANGAFVEDVLEVCKIRLEAYQNSPFMCPENAEAIEGIEKAVEALTRRREDRKKRGVLGKNEK